MRRQRRRLLRRLGFAAIPTLALLFAGEAGVRLAGGALETGVASGWTMAPDLQEHAVAAGPNRFTVSTNADGLRSSAARARTPGKARVLAFGDSTVFGWGLPAEGAPPARLEDALGPGWEVVNAGQPGHSSEQAARLASALIPAYEPDGVVWFHPWHDVARAAETDRDRLAADRPWWAASALLRRLARPVAGPADPLFPERMASAKAGAVERVPAPHRRDALERVRDAAGGAWMIVVLLPNDVTLARADRSPLAAELEATCEDLGLAFIDPTGTLRGRPIEEVTIPGDRGHFTAEANAALVEPVAREIGRRSRG